MLLRELVDYAERLDREDNTTVLPSGYQKVGIRWIINLDRDGKIMGKLTPTTNGLEGKREGPKLFLAPQLVRAAGIKAKLLADNAEYVLGREREVPPDRKVQYHKKVRQRHESFIKAVRECANAIHIPEVEAVAHFLETSDLASVEFPNEIDLRRDIFTFSIDGVLPIDLPEVRSYWGNTYCKSTDGKQEDVLETECLISGEYGPVMEREPVKIKGIPGGQTSGTNLISANQRAFESYGLSHSQVAPVRVEYAEKYANALNRLLKDYQTHLRIGPVVYVFWAKDAPPPPVVESLTKPDAQNPLLASLFAGHTIDLAISDRPEQVKKGLLSPWAGREFEAIRANTFYAVSLSASGGRVVVRNHLTTTVGDAREKLRAYFKAQEMVASGGGISNPLGIYALAGSLYRDANKEMSPTVPVSLLEFALRGDSLPFAFLQQIVRRNRAERKVTYPRAALTKMVLISRGKEMIGMEKLRTERPEVAYHLGRLLAALENIQKAAQPGINASIVDRFYGSASATPAWVFGRLLNGAQNNLGKLRNSRPGIYVASEKRLQEIMGHIQDFPPVLKVEDQALFGLGYYHEKAHHWEQIKEHAEDKKKPVEQSQDENPAN